MALIAGPESKWSAAAQADAWITWPNGPINNTKDMDMVYIDNDQAIWRDLNIVASPKADSQTQDFLDFLITDQAQKIMKTEGWQR